jgi:predicted acetyltransferase
MANGVPLIDVIAVPLEQQPVRANLLELCIHDCSEHQPVEIGVDGRYGYPRLPLNWSDPDRHPFHIVPGDTAEFFVLRGCRRHRIGRLTAHLVFQRFPGPWQVRVRQSNLPAKQFAKIYLAK